MKNKKIYFLGIGGIGMSALAQYFLSEGADVYGYDLTPSPITKLLTDKGAIIHFDDNKDKIPSDIAFAIYTPAVPQSNREFQYFIETGIPIYKRAQILGQLTEKMPSIAIAGTHGKTTTTTMIAHLLAPEVSIAAFIGGIAKNFDDNLVLGEKPVIAVAEADEYDRSFLALRPSVAVITAMDADHLDIYGSRDNLVAAFNQYASQSQILVIEENVANEVEHPNKRTYGLLPSADYYAYNIQLAPNHTTLDLHTPNREFHRLQLHSNGLYNVLNITAAIAAILEEAHLCEAVCNTISDEHISAKLKSFAGVKRRFDYIIDRDDFVFIDDYAHHPEEMRSLIHAIRELYPGKHLCGIFQPHLFSRTKDFAMQFAEVLSILDEVILLPIYPAREAPIPGITSDYLCALISNPNKRVLQKEEVIPYLRSHQPDVLITIGAGDIDRCVPEIKTAFE